MGEHSTTAFMPFKLEHRTGVNFIKLFQLNVCPYQHNLNQNLTQCTNNSINYTKNALLATCVNFINLFQLNICPYQHNLNQNLTQCTDSSTNYTENVLLTPCVNLIKLLKALFTPITALPKSKYKVICRKQHKLFQKCFMKLTTSVNFIKLFKT
jgi:hypothetical protein